MILTPQQTLRFYNVWFPLLYFVNQQRQLVDDFPATYGSNSVSPQVAAKLREALWADDGLREAFLAENPAGLGQADLDLVKSWDHRVAGDFMFFRQLKKYAVLLSRNNSSVAYGVLGLVSSLEDISPLPPPTMINTVLLPFEGKIIYDSLISSYNVFFGGGIRSSLNEGYKAAQERGTLYTSLEPVDAGDAKKEIEARNSKLLDAFVSRLAGGKMSITTAQKHRAAIEHFADYLLRKVPPHGLLLLRVSDLDSYMGTEEIGVSPVSFRHFVRFLRDTNRINWGLAEDLLDALRE